MSKERRRDGPVKMVKPLPMGPEVAALRQAPVEEKVRYAFASAARCPGCRTTDTVVVKTDGQVRYWRCRTPRCRFSMEGGRRTWKEIGEPI